MSAAPQASLEVRVQLLEDAVAQLRRQLPPETGKTGWLSQVVGSFRDDPEFDEAYRLGREYRENYSDQPPAE